MSAIDPVARVVMRGVRTVGTAGHGRREYYAAQDVHALVAVIGEVDGVPLGALAPVGPTLRFGFGSTPARPTMVRLTTLIDGATPLRTGSSG